MLRIGIIGSESSHAMQFAKYFNLPDPFTGEDRHPDIRVTAIMGDSESAGRTAEQARIPCIAESLEELVDTVDAVMITSRRGSEHMAQAMPFIEQGMPLFIDKPFTSDLAEARELALALQQRNCPVLGGSGCKYSPGVQRIKELVAPLVEEGKLLTASLDFPIMLDSIYDGFYFYAPHLVEICLEIFGTDIEAVQAVKTEKSLVTNVTYPSFIVSLHFVTEVWKHTCTLITEEGTKVMPMDTAGSLEEEAARFAKLLHGEFDSLSAQELILPNAVIDAILRAAATGRTINFTKEVLQ